MSHIIPTLATRQGGHVTREQLVAAGVAPATISRWVARRKLIRVHHGIYAVGHLPSNPVDTAHAALLAGGERSALAGGCALVLWGVWRHWPGRLEIVTAGDRRPKGLLVHRSSTLLKRDIMALQGLRVTSPARTMLDTALRLGPERLARAVNDLRLRQELTLAALADVTARNPTHPAARQLASHLELAQPEPTRSELEDRFLRLLRRHRLPTPQINAHVCGYRVDAYFEEQRLVVELDGWASHKTRERFREDRRRDLDVLVRAGIPTVRLPAEDVSDATVLGLRQLLRDRSQPRARRGGPAQRFTD